MNNILKKIQILFWKTYAVLWNLRPRKHMPKKDYLKIVRKINKAYGKVFEMACYSVSHEELGGFDFWHKEKSKRRKINLRISNEN